MLQDNERKKEIDEKVYACPSWRGRESVCEGGRGQCEREKRERECARVCVYVCVYVFGRVCERECLGVYVREKRCDDSGDSGDGDDGDGDDGGVSV